MWPWRRPAPPPPPAPDPEEISVAKAILLLGFRTHNGLTEVADTIAAAIRSLTERQLRFTLLSEGVPMGAPVTAVVGRSSTSTVVESIKATGQVVPNVGPLVYASDNTSVATIDANGNWTAVASGTANLSALDQGNGLTDTVALTVTAAPPPPPSTADTMTFTLNP